ncbi:hypothetical protein X975_22135, partial [Stegodyphus mimosarum]
MKPEKSLTNGTFSKFFNIADKLRYCSNNISSNNSSSSNN